MLYQLLDFRTFNTINYHKFPVLQSALMPTMWRCGRCHGSASTRPIPVLQLLRQPVQHIQGCPGCRLPVLHALRKFDAVDISVAVVREGTGRQLLSRTTGTGTGITNSDLQPTPIRAAQYRYHTYRYCNNTVRTHTSANTARKRQEQLETYASVSTAAFGHHTGTGITVLSSNCSRGDAQATTHHTLNYR